MKALHSRNAAGPALAASSPSSRYMADMMPSAFSTPAGTITADTDSDTEPRKCIGFQPSSALRLIAMVANFGVVNCMKMSAPEALSLAIWASMVVSVTLYAASATIGILRLVPHRRARGDEELRDLLRVQIGMDRLARVGAEARQ